MKLEQQIRIDLRRKDRDSKALSRLIGIKREVVQLRRTMQKNAGALGDGLRIYEEIAELVKDIPEGLECACCGFRNLKNFQRRDGNVIGPECIHHALGECKKR